jgi:hypothetical protein
MPTQMPTQVPIQIHTVLVQGLRVEMMTMLKVDVGKLEMQSG